MKLKSLIFSGIITLAFSTSLHAQMGGMGQLLQVGLQDAEKLTAAYISPFANGFGATMNAGWYNSAKPHKLLGFSLTFTTSVAFIPASGKSFDVNALGLSSNAVITSPGSIAPTVAGAKDADLVGLRYSQEVLGTPVTLVEFDLPKGTGFGFIPAPMLSLGLGLVKDTDIRVRYVPNTNLWDYGDVGLWGVGIKHSLKQWIPFLRRLPVLNLSLQGGYTQFNLGSNLNFQPDPTWINRTTGISFDNQRFELSVKSYTANLIVSADIPFITFYGGLGISSTNTNVAFKGYYPIPAIDTMTRVVYFSNETIGGKDPLNISIKHKSGSMVLPRLNAGFKLKLAIITIHADYTYSDYSILTAGLGISFR